MAEITRYVTVDKDNNEGRWEFDTLVQAISAAGLDEAVIERTYVYDDSDLVYTPDGSGTWPPA